MTPFATLVVGSAASLLLDPHGPTSPDVVSSVPSQVRLLCEDDLGGALCSALERAVQLAARSDSHDAAVGELTTISFVSEIRTPTRLSGHLVWETGDGRSGTGPTLELSVVDMAMTDRMLGAFAVELLRHSNIPQ